jgi:hypothetical protein
MVPESRRVSPAIVFKGQPALAHHFDQILRVAKSIVAIK